MYNHSININDKMLMNQYILFLNGNINVNHCENYITENFENFKIFVTDGAFNKIKNNKLISKKINKVIGDFDSLKYNADNFLFHLDKNQNNTDFEKALNYLLKKDIKELYIFGASGGEMDHFLSNMSIAKKYKNKLNLIFIDEYSKYFFTKKIQTVKSMKNKMFSILPFPFATNIYYKGLKYPLNGENLTLGESTGVRNYAKENTVSITYDNGDILLFISHKKYNHIL